MSFLNHKGLLNLIYTQNIDSLEFKAKIPKEKIVFAHGNLLESHCSKCYIECDFEKQQNHIKEGKILYCQSCNSPCKPKVVFYGEGLPKEFFNRQNELIDSDLCFIMGSSLKVYPFAYLPFTINKNAWRLVINRERVGEENTWNSFQYDSLGSQDAFIEGSTDDIVIKILKDAGWKDEFDSFINSFSI
jgi:NAD-dependent SIR2 family protein deacetylase